LAKKVTAQGWNRLGCSLGGDSRNITSTGNEDRRLACHEFGSQCGETTELTFGPTVIDRHVLAVDIACLNETMLERRDHGRIWPRRSAVEITNPRHRRLLRARGERPCNGCAPEQSGA
jgi:hypothetical protein